jgi:hypothetical protein
VPNHSPAQYCSVYFPPYIKINDFLQFSARPG